MENNFNKLGISTGRILFCSACKPYWISKRVEWISTENSTGDNHFGDILHIRVLYLKEPLEWRYAISFLFIIGAVYFAFKK
jgi:hypothetical protein